MQVDLPAMLKLQERDKAVAALEEQIRALQPEIEALDAELHQVEEQLASAKQNTKEADTRRAELEGRIESYRVMQERRRQRLEWVKGAKEASTIMAELDLARSVLAREEAEWMRSADRLQEAEERVAEAERSLEEVKGTQAPLREALAVKMADFEAQLEVRRAEREVAAKDVAPRLLEVYNRIRRGRAPLALYPLRGGACGHCFTSVPLHRRQQIQNEMGVEACEVCGVLVYQEVQA